MHARHLDLHGFRRGLGHVVFEERGNLVGRLVRHQAHADLGHRHGRKHGLRAFACETREQTVHLERGTRPGAFERRESGLAVQLRNAEVLAILLLVERQRRPCLTFRVLQRHHIVVEARNLDVAAAVFHC